MALWVCFLSYSSFPPLPSFPPPTPFFLSFFLSFLSFLRGSFFLSFFLSFFSPRPPLRSFLSTYPLAPRPPLSPSPFPARGEAWGEGGMISLLPVSLSRLIENKWSVWYYVSRSIFFSFLHFFLNFLKVSKEDFFFYKGSSFEFDHSIFFFFRTYEE